MNFKTTIHHEGLSITLPDKIVSNWLRKHNYLISYNYDIRAFEVTKGKVTDKSWNEITQPDKQPDKSS